MSAMSDAMENAGIRTDVHRLNVAATNILSRNRGDFGRSLARFLEIIDQDRALRHALAEAYLRDRAADMSGESLRADGHCAIATRSLDAVCSRPNEDDAGHIPSADRAIPRLPASSSPKTDDGGHGHSAKQARSRVPSSSVPVRSEVRQCASDFHSLHAPAPKPNPPRGLSAIKSVQPIIAKSILDTYKVRDGRAIGDLSWHELTKLARTNEAEAHVLRYIADHAANAPSHAKVREIVKPVVVQAAIKHAEAINAVV